MEEESWGVIHGPESSYVRKEKNLSPISPSIDSSKGVVAHVFEPLDRAALWYGLIIIGKTFTSPSSSN